jgi:hypothetical protein
VHTFSGDGVNGVFANKPETNNFDTGSCAPPPAGATLVALGVIQDYNH